MKEAYGTARILAIAGCSGMYRFEEACMELQWDTMRKATFQR